jgi:HD superfamily phosphodiesterase
MSIFRCGLQSIHGPSHWQRVENFGLDIAKSSGADLTVVRLFALLHDSCRQEIYGCRRCPKVLSANRLLVREFIKNLFAL